MFRNRLAKGSHSNVTDVDASMRVNLGSGAIIGDTLSVTVDDTGADAQLPVCPAHWRLLFFIQIQRS